MLPRPTPLDESIDAHRAVTILPEPVGDCRSMRPGPALIAEPAAHRAGMSHTDLIGDC
jgi:hypothetical protein